MAIVIIRNTSTMLTGEFFSVSYRYPHTLPVHTRRCLLTGIFFWEWYRSEWDIHSFSDEDIGPTMARFAIQSLAMLATQNQTVSIRGSVPYLGSRLVVNWWRFIALLSCIVGAHFALFAVTVLWVTKVAKADMIKEPQKGIMP